MQITILLVWHERTAIYIYSGSSTILWFMHIKTQNFIITITFFDYVTRMQFKLKTHLLPCRSFLAVFSEFYLETCTWYWQSTSHISSYFSFAICIHYIVFGPCLDTVMSTNIAQVLTASHQWTNSYYFMIVHHQWMPR